MTPESVFHSEKDQIERAGLNAFVSITDHDCIDGNNSINRLEPAPNMPVSIEWTVPFGCGFFHIGVHNLPLDARSIVTTLLEFTNKPEVRSADRLDEIFELLDEIPSVLIVLNHPLWDIEMIGQRSHEKLLRDFLGKHGRWIHAIEVNGFRRWSENNAAIEMAESLGLPAVGGGDRHGCQANTVMNISRVSSFEEFVDDVRVARTNEMVLMPAYERPIVSRQLQSFAEILGDYPGFVDGRTHWIDRIYFDAGEGLKSVAELGMINGPFWLRAAIRILGVLGNPRLAVLFRFVRRRADRVPSNFDHSSFLEFEVEEVGQELSSEPMH